MESEWVTSSVGEVSHVVTKGTTPTTLGFHFQNDGIRFVKVETLSSDGAFFPDKFAYISEEAHHALARSQLREDDILFSIAGTIGRTALVTSDWLPANTNQAIAIVRPNTKIVSPKFLRYVLTNPSFTQTANTKTVQSVQANFSLGELKLSKFDLPPISVQQEIVSLLGSLDDRITLLRETNKTLEAIAQVIFKSWFIDFDPVREKMEGRAPAGLDEATAALFPEVLVESELGLVPKGWEVIPFRSAIEVIGGGTPKTSVDEYWGGDIPWFSVVDAPNQSDVFVVDTEKKITAAGLDGSSTKLLPVGTTIISARGTVGKIALTGCEMAMNQSCYGLRGRAKDRYFTYFSTARLVSQLKKNAHGSVFDTITQETFAGVRLAYPSHALINAYENFIDPMMMKIRSNLYQVKTLAEIRGGLLPRLISGKLRLSGSLENVA